MSVLDLEFRVITKTGEQRWLRNHSMPRRLPSGDVIWDGIGLDVTAEVNAEKRLTFLASHDPLTGLPNRPRFLANIREAVAASIRNGRPIAVLKLDIDGFHEVNEAVGLAGGDTVIRGIAQRLKSLPLGSKGSVARVGGDEFAVLRTDMLFGETVADLAAYIGRTLVEPLSVESTDVVLDVCVGGTSFPSEGTDGMTIDAIGSELAKQGDQALHEAKQYGRGTYRVYSVGSDLQLRDRIALRQSLRRALDEQQFTLHYQPQVSLQSGQLVGAEALVRWEHPELGLRRPDKFLPLAETSGLIVPLGEWVLKTAMEQTSRWRERQLSPPIVSTNVSGVQLQHPGFLQSVERTVAETGVDPRTIEFEITEGVLLEASRPIIEVLGAIKSLGFGLAVDDFGAGHASFRYLREFPFDKLKIDQLFVRQMVVASSDAAIVRAMIALASNLGLEVVAEGIETLAQRDFLRDEGCRIGQGYLFSRPLTAEAFCALLERGGDLQVDDARDPSATIAEPAARPGGAVSASTAAD